MTAILPLIGLLLYFPLYKNTTVNRITPVETLIVSLILIGLILPIRYFFLSSVTYSVFLIAYYIALGEDDPLFFLTRLIFIFWVILFISVSVIIRSKTFSSLKKQTAELRVKSDSLVDLNRSLDKKVNDRTKELQITNNELKEFAYIVSHDLKSPMYSLNMMLTELTSNIENDDTQKAKELFPPIFHNLEGMVNLVDGVLRYSNISNISSSPSIDEQADNSVDLNKVIENIKEILQPPKHIQILIPRPLPVIIKFDETRLLQLFQKISV